MWRTGRSAREKNNAGSRAAGSTRRERNRASESRRFSPGARSVRRAPGRWRARCGGPADQRVKKIMQVAALRVALDEKEIERRNRGDFRLEREVFDERPGVGGRDVADRPISA